MGGSRDREPALGATEIWEFPHATADAHPIHVHLVDFRILGRQRFAGVVSPKNNTACDGVGIQGGVLTGVKLHGPKRGRARGEDGKKDTAKNVTREKSPASS
jgi:spore coat protein A